MPRRLKAFLRGDADALPQDYVIALAGVLGAMAVVLISLIA